eukprot:3664772-Heterocapsa_arctica.AAC.1
MCCGHGLLSMALTRLKRILTRRTDPPNVAVNHKTNQQQQASEQALGCLVDVEALVPEPGIGKARLTSHTAHCTSILEVQ